MHFVHLSPGIVKQSQAALGAMTQNAAFSQTLVASGGSGFVWTVISGGIAGLSLSPSGVLSGTPSGSGSYSITIRVTNGRGRSRDVTYAGSITAVVTDPYPVGTTLTMAQAGGSWGPLDIGAPYGTWSVGSVLYQDWVGTARARVAFSTSPTPDVYGGYHNAPADGLVYYTVANGADTIYPPTNALPNATGTWRITYQVTAVQDAELNELFTWAPISMQRVA